MDRHYRGPVFAALRRGEVERCSDPYYCPPVSRANAEGGVGGAWGGRAPDHTLACLDLPVRLF
jgi:hypothetical protein